MLKKRTQINFNRHQTESGTFKTTINFERNKVYTQKQSGVIHKTVGFFENRFIGDVPSMQKYLKSKQPTTVKGHVALGVVKGSNTFIRHAKNLTVKTALTAENGALKISSHVGFKLKRKLQNDFVRNSVDDTSRGILMAGGFLKDAANGLSSHRKSKKNYKFEKKEFVKRKNNLKFTEAKNKSNLTQQKVYFSEKKQVFKEQKKSFKVSNKTNVQKQVFRRRKELYKSKKKDFKKFQKFSKKSTASFRKSTKNQAAIKKFSDPGFLIFKPFNYAARKALTSGWRKAANADNNNDFMKAADKGVAIVSETIKNQKQNKIKKAKKKDSKLKRKQSKSQGKLQAQKAKLQSKSKAKSKKRKYNTNKGIGKFGKFGKVSAVVNAANKLSSAQNMIKSGLMDIAKKVGIAFIPVIAYILIALMVFSLFAGIFSNTAFVMGTYTAKDNDLSKSIEYYTKISQEYKEKVHKVNSNSWKSALQYFGIDTSDYNRNPDEIVYGYSNYFPYTTNYDYDSWKLLSFLCAYFYDFSDSSTSLDDVAYWEYEDSISGFIIETLLTKLFEYEYEFQHYYEYEGHWEQLNNYTFYPECGSYWLVDKSKVYWNYFVPEGYPSEINDFLDENGCVHFNNNFEILNVNDNDKRTGWYVQDQRLKIIDPSGNSRDGFYQLKDGSFSEYGHWDGDDWVDRGYWGFPDYQIYYTVTPDDSKMFNDSIGDKCLISFYRRNEWVEQCTLYYNIRRIRSFDDAIIKLLKEKERSAERIEYYKFLSEGEDGEEPLLGNHQSIASPLGDAYGIRYLLSNNLIYNRYGWDIQYWEQESHCSLNKCHKGVDIACNSNSNVYSMVKGKITSISSNKKKIVIESTAKVDLWHDKGRKIRVTYYNVSTNMNVGDEFDAGAYIGKSTNSRFCDEISGKNDAATVDYIHIKVEVRYGLSWTHHAEPVDPLLLINY